MIELGYSVYYSVFTGESLAQIFRQSIDRLDGKLTGTGDLHRIADLLIQQSFADLGLVGDIALVRITVPRTEEGIDLICTIRGSQRDHRADDSMIFDLHVFEVGGLDETEGPFQFCTAAASRFARD